MIPRFLHSLAKLALHPRCPLCRCRTPHITAHLWIDHFGEDA